MRFYTSIFMAIVFAISLQPYCRAQPVVEDGEWPVYAREAGGNRYSPLSQITKSNVKNLKRAWTVRTGDIAEGPEHYMECTPLMVDNTLYVITTFSRLIAYNATIGEKKWSFDPDPPLSHRETGAGGLASRGVAYWKSGGKERIFLPVRDGRLYSVDTKTGKLDRSFGKNGMINLRDGLPDGGRFLFLSSPPAIYKNIVIAGFGIDDSASRHAKVPVRAFDAHSGKEVWRFNTIPDAGETGAETWDDDSWRGRGGGNVWSIMSVDAERGLVFLPVSTPNYDFYGGDRHGDGLFTDSIVVLDAATGTHRWHFQTVHHDLWDYDLAAQPNLLDLSIDGKTVPAVVALGKTGFTFILHRETGKPLFPIEERPVPASDIPGEQTSPSQPVPLKPPAFVRQSLDESGLSQIDEETANYVKDKFRKLKNKGIFTPVGTQGTLVIPGLHGGANWSGAAASPDGMLYVNTTDLPYVLRLGARENQDFAYTITGFDHFRDQNGYPAIAPPWGELVKIDCNRGDIVWHKPLGEFPELTAKGIPITGQENFGGATVTASGLVFIASTMDGCIRAFDADSGKELWKHQMEVAGYAAPVTYTGSDGRQYVAICAGGGGKAGTPHGDYIIAFALND